jgi:cytoskeletal protein CcmA (bactofilin family)
MSEQSGAPGAGKATVVEEGTTLKGSLSSSCAVNILGKIDGEVTGPLVEVASSGSIRGTVKATTIRSRGELSGRFEADEIELAGRVLDDTVIKAKVLQLAPGASGIVFGACQLEIGDAPDKAQAVREAGSPKRPRPEPAPDKEEATSSAQPAPDAGA